MTHFSHVLKDRSSQIARDTILDLGLAAMCLIDEGGPLARFASICLQRTSEVVGAAAQSPGVRRGKPLSLQIYP